MKQLLHFAFALWAVSSAAASSAPNVVYTFECTGTNLTQTCADGAGPVVLIQSTDGNFYGASYSSVAGEAVPKRGGTVFSLTSTGQVTLLHQFSDSKASSSGSLPITLVEGSDGNLYGTTQSGGGNFAGVLFRLAKDGSNFQVLHRFCSQANCGDGSLPIGIASGKDGNIYGVTRSGGSANDSCAALKGCGTFFRYALSAGKYSILAVLDGSSVSAPSGIALASDGNFYGTCFGFQGCVFRATTAGEFTGIANLGLFNPGLGVVQGADGNLYGVGRSIIGAHPDQLFELGLNGKNLQKFSGLGNYSVATPISGSVGNLWAAYSDGTSDPGGILELSPEDGSVLQTFPFAGTDISLPSGLIEAADGTFWGLATSGTASGGSFASGAVFNLNAGLSPR